MSAVYVVHQQFVLGIIAVFLKIKLNMYHL